MSDNQKEPDFFIACQTFERKAKGFEGHITRLKHLKIFSNSPRLNVF